MVKRICISAPKYLPQDPGWRSVHSLGHANCLTGEKKKKKEIKVNCEFKALGVTHITSTQILLAKMIYRTSPDFKLQGYTILFLGGSSQITMTKSEIIGQG